MRGRVPDISTYRDRCLAPRVLAPLVASAVRCLTFRGSPQEWFPCRVWQMPNRAKVWTQEWTQRRDRPVSLAIPVC
jgi:hypothetical protein